MYIISHDLQNIVVVQLLSPVWLFAFPWTTACQAPLFSTVSWSLLRLIPSSGWCYQIILSSAAPVTFCLQSFPGLAIPIRWPKYWSFSLASSLSYEYSGLISYRTDHFDYCTVQGNLKESSPAPQFESINSSAFSLLYGPTLKSIHDYWKNDSYDYMDLCKWSGASAS